MASRIELKGSRVLILGGSGVLGGLIATELDRFGSRVMLAGRDARRLQQHATRIGPAVPSVIFDMAIPSHADRVVDTAVQHLGGLDGVVNAAGIVAFGDLAETDDATLDTLAAVDFLGPLRVIRAALPHLDPGFVVSISGVVAETPVAGMAAYSAVKAALSTATVALGREVRRRGIHVLDARPPHTETGLAGHPIAGVAPAMPPGLDPALVAGTIVSGLAEGRRELPAESFLSA